MKDTEDINICITNENENEIEDKDLVILNCEFCTKNVKINKNNFKTEKNRWAMCSKICFDKFFKLSNALEYCQKNEHKVFTREFTKNYNLVQKLQKEFKSYRKNKKLTN
ncbi:MULTISPECIES: hypothetical protein [unclassified Spiroplasma]|uniref:hypothetical protein n=1 Tax=unclassified Spiroplasma TaxID=2637901 RepID=UPI0030CD3C1E